MHALCARLGPEADVYLFRLWAYCGRERLDGRFPGPGADLAVERAVRWRGRRGRLVEGLLAVGLLVVEGEDLVVAKWEEEQGAHIAKVDRDRTKPDGRSRGSSEESANLPRESLQTPARDTGGERGEKRRETKSPGRKAEEKTPGERVPVAPQPPPLTNPPKAPRGKPEGVARESGGKESLPDGVNRVHLAVKGVPYDWRPGRDDPAARDLLSRGSVAEVLRRLENGLRAHFKQRCDTLTDLVRRWEANATPEHRADAGQPSAPAEARRRTDAAVGRGEAPKALDLPDTPAGAAWAQVLEGMRERGKSYAAGQAQGYVRPVALEGGCLVLEAPDRYALNGLEDLRPALESCARALGLELRATIAGQPADAHAGGLQ
ncbi:hypothetical protein [Myxococcus virescens]|uniref:DnaA N-terminal domain-containing protein n=1 Tax=Myxococcus virescens TaxID=83456 RepID=A0ABY0ML36_9BACT|nr:hypothetical protein [Myxococcus virescens]SDD64682.1 hypothetical protein SAMN04488504_102108 [Myxococcus virescens]